MTLVDPGDCTRPPSGLTILDESLPWPELSRLARADQRARDPIYGVHRWWARRPPAVMRGLLLAGALPHTSTMDDYWSQFADAGSALDGLTAYDPFSGGGSTLVEARRLGASVSGCDVDPLAALITNFELNPPTALDLTRASEDLLKHVSTAAVGLYPSGGDTPLHYFHLRDVTCPGCELTGPLYRNLIIARDVSKVGAVVRDAPLTVFCPTCFAIHNLSSPDRVELRCCGSRHRIDMGNFHGSRYTCPGCQRRSNHTDLQTGASPTRVLAVEETVANGRRVIREPSKADLAALRKATSRRVELAAELDLPTGSFDPVRREQRPLSFGITDPKMLFTDRQIICLGSAFHWIKSADVSLSVRQGLTLALSNALATNNLLCGYATDYGRLSALFSVRSYSLPALAVELAPLHPDSGRGTLPRSLQRVIRSTTSQAQRHVWSVDKKQPERVTFDFAPAPAEGAVACRSAADAPIEPASVDLCITDPPYFDFIYYSELSEFHRLWLNMELDDRPLLPESGEGKVSSFANGLGACLRQTATALKPGRSITFTYHATNPDAWEAVGLALDAAKLVVTALWPLRNDGHMGLHSSAGNCEWDVAVVCRPLDECTRSLHDLEFESWARTAEPYDLHFSDADERNVRAALEMAADRFARYEVTA